MIITGTLAKVIAGEMQLERVPQGLRQGIEHMLDFYCYQKSCWVLEADTRGFRRMRLETLPDHLRPGVEAWVVKLFESRKSKGK